MFQKLFKCFTCIGSFNPRNNPERQQLLLLHLRKLRYKDVNLANVTKITNYRVGIYIRSSCPIAILNHFNITELFIITKIVRSRLIFGLRATKKYLKTNLLIQYQKYYSQQPILWLFHISIKRIKHFFYIFYIFKTHTFSKVCRNVTKVPGSIQ